MMNHDLLPALAHPEQLAIENRFALFDPSVPLLLELFGFVQALMAHAALVPRLLSLDTGETWIGELSNKELRNLVKINNIENRGLMAKIGARERNHGGFA